MKPDDGYIAYIVNPKSGASSSNLESRKFGRYLIERSFDVRFDLTSSLQNARELAVRAASDDDCAMVVVVGGDGTIREVANGLANSHKPLLMIPAGTENLLANELGFDERLKTVIRAFEGNYIRPLDLGRANGRCFIAVTGFGFDGRVVEMVSRQRKGHIDHLDYFWPLWRTFWNYKFDPMRVEVDGEEIFHDRGLVFVGNISRYAMGLEILRHADYGDGLLDICIYKCASHLRLAKHAAMTVLKNHWRCSDVIYCKGKKITVNSDVPGMASQIDGDPGPPLPVHIEVIPQAVNVMVSEGAKPAGIRTRIVRAIG